MLSTKKLLYKICQKIAAPVVREIKASNQINWYSTSNPYSEQSFSVAKTGYKPIAVSYWMTGVGSSTVAVSVCCIDGDNIQFNARMINNTPATTTQNKVSFAVTYIKSDWIQ